MIVRIRARDLPGRTFVSDGEQLDNVHVGPQIGREPADLVRADAESAEWVVEVDRTDDDWRGEAVQGKKGDRFLYLTWGDVKPDGSFAMFRRAKLMLDRIDPSLRTADELVADVVLTDERGCPLCARVDPPYLAWSAPSRGRSRR